MEKIAAVLALMVGVMAIRVSAKAMRGWQPGWKVIVWLPVYNFVMGIITLVPAVLLWINHPFALTASLITLGVHTIVLLLLLTVFRNKIAKQSIRAMTFRVAVWVVILILLWFRQN